MLGKIIIRWIITAIAVAAAVILVRPGIEVGSNAAFTVFAMAAILGLVNAFLKPVLEFMSCGLIMLTLGLFTLVINAGTLLISSWMAQNWFNVDFVVHGFWPAFWGAIIISIVSFVLSIFVSDK
jgi:putative membrane protein